MECFEVAACAGDAIGSRCGSECGARRTLEIAVFGTKAGVTREVGRQGDGRKEPRLSDLGFMGHVHHTESLLVGSE